MSNQQLDPKRLSEITDRILKKSKEATENILFSDPEEIAGLKGLSEGQFEADPEKAYGLYYSGIERTLTLSLPKDKSITRPIRELKCILLTGKEKNSKTGVRGADSRMQNISTMEAIIGILDEWSRTSLNPMELANLLLVKNKELGFIPAGREISDYL